MWGKSWKVETDNENKKEATRRFEISIITCLAEEGYKLSMAINMDTTSRVFFFIKGQEDTKEVRVMDMAGAGMGSKDTLSIYRPIVSRRKSSFFRSYKRNTSLSKRIRVSLRKKVNRKSSKPLAENREETETAWWQQTSTDSGVGVSGQ